MRIISSRRASEWIFEFLQNPNLKVDGIFEMGDDLRITIALRVKALGFDKTEVIALIVKIFAACLKIITFPVFWMIKVVILSQ